MKFRELPVMAVLPIIFLFVLFLLSDGMADASASPSYPAIVTQKMPSDPGTDTPSSESGVDILDGKFQILNDSNFEFWMRVSDFSNVKESLGYMVLIDNNLDGQSDFNLGTSGDVLAREGAERFGIMDMASQTEITSCSGIVSEYEVIGTDNWIVFNLPSKCLNLASRVNIKFASFVGGAVVDRVPNSPKWTMVKTKYLDSQLCNRAQNGSSLSYMAKQYMCVSQAGKWIFIDKGLFLAKSAKYLTDKAYYSCVYGKPGFSLSDKGKTLTISHLYGSYEESAEINCIYSKAQFPNWLQDQIDMTRAIDGMQKAEYGKYVLTWTYHPDHGFNMVLRLK